MINFSSEVFCTLPEYLNRPTFIYHLANFRLPQGKNVINNANKRIEFFGSHLFMESEVLPRKMIFKPKNSKTVTVVV